MRYYEDIEVGEIERFGAYKVTREEVIAFATQYDPQPFHLSDEAAAQTYFGRLSASGWHTCAMMMRMLADQMQDRKQAGLGSPGLEELRWLKPVYPGDTLSCELEIIDKRISTSRPDMGITRGRNTVFNQDGEAVLSLISTGLISVRAAIKG
jgi:acyl dehydratase